MPRSLKTLPLEERMKLYEEAMRLKKEKEWGPKKIAENLDLKKFAIYGWFYYDCKPNRKPVHKGRKSNSANLSPSKDLFYIIGVYYGDGYVPSPNVLKSKSYPIKLLTSEKKFAQTFAVALKKIGLKPHIYTTKPRKNIWYIAQANSKNLYNELRSLTFEKLDKRLKKKERIVAFLKGFYESEGSTYKNLTYRRKDGTELRHYRLVIYNTKEDLLRFVAYLLKKLNFKFKFHRYKNKATAQGFYSCLIIYRQAEIERFHNLIRPSIKKMSST